MPLDKDVYLGAIEREGQLLAKAGDRNLGAVVPACPGWTVQTVLVHLGRVYRSVTEHVVARATEMIPFTKTPSPDGFEVVEWYRESMAQLLDALRELGPDEPVWTWSDDHTGDFYFRRMAHETAMHRYDAEAATGTRHRSTATSRPTASPSSTNWYCRSASCAARSPCRAGRCTCTAPTAKASGWSKRSTAPSR